MANKKCAKREIDTVEYRNNRTIRTIQQSEQREAWSGRRRAPGMRKKVRIVKPMRYQTSIAYRSVIARGNSESTARSAEESRVRVIESRPFSAQITQFVSQPVFPLFLNHDSFALFCDLCLFREII